MTVLYCLAPLPVCRIDRESPQCMSSALSATSAGNHARRRRSRRSLISTGHHVVDRAGVFNPQWPGHPLILPARASPENRKPGPTPRSRRPREADDLILPARTSPENRKPGPTPRSRPKTGPDPAKPTTPRSRPDPAKPTRGLAEKAEAQGQCGSMGDFSNVSPRRLGPRPIHGR